MIDARKICAFLRRGKPMSSVTKKAANLTVRADLLEEARARKINLSQTLEIALAAELKRQREAEWLEQNRDAIAAYNRFVAEHGVFSDRFRNFCAIERSSTSIAIPDPITASGFPMSSMLQSELLTDHPTHVVAPCG
jgi:antitoxin CcdA